MATDKMRDRKKDKRVNLYVFPRCSFPLTLQYSPIYPTPHSDLVSDVGETSCRVHDACVSRPFGQQSNFTHPKVHFQSPSVVAAVLCAFTRPKCPPQNIIPRSQLAPQPHRFAGVDLTFISAAIGALKEPTSCQGAAETRPRSLLTSGVTAKQKTLDKISQVKEDALGQVVQSNVRFHPA